MGCAIAPRATAVFRIIVPALDAGESVESDCGSGQKTISTGLVRVRAEPCDLLPRFMVQK